MPRVASNRMVAWRIASSVRTPRSWRERPSPRRGRECCAGRAAGRLGIIDLTIQYNSTAGPVKRKAEPREGRLGRPSHDRVGSQLFVYGTQELKPQSASVVQLSQRLRPVAHHMPVLEPLVHVAGCEATHWVVGQSESCWQLCPLFAPDAQTPVQFCPGTDGSQ